MKITRKQLRRIIREQMTYDQRDSDRYDDPDGPEGWADMSRYDMGFDDALQHMDPMMDHDEEYMQGYRDGKDELAPMPDEGIRRRGW